MRCSNGCTRPTAAAARWATRGGRADGVGEVGAPGGGGGEPWLRRAEANGVAVRAASAVEVEGRCGSPAHQGVCARAGPYPYASAASLLGVPEALLVALDQVQDPQNLGSICRTAECAGAAGGGVAQRPAAPGTPPGGKAPP